MFLQSERRFGLEIEFSTETEKQLNKLKGELKIIHDGSLRPLRYAGEYVSEPLQGAGGEAEVKRACGILFSGGASTESTKTSMHIHLDGKKEGGNLRSSRIAPKLDIKVIAVSNRIKKEVSTATILEIVSSNRTLQGIDGVVRTKIENINYYSKVQLERKPRLNYTYYWLERPDRFKWLQNSFYFYTLFSDVMENIVSKSRRYGNMYSIPLGNSYELADIANCKTEDDIKSVWYKGRQPGGDYCNSRYHNVNLHCYWHKHGTLEIRSHGGTVDASKVLLWLRLHQTIADKLEVMEFNDLKSMKGTPQEFLAILDDQLLQDYVKRLFGYYSNTKIK